MGKGVEVGVGAGEAEGGAEVGVGAGFMRQT